MPDTGMLAEKTINFCSCQSSYNYTNANGTTFHSDGNCIQDDPNIPPWCLVVEKSCSQPPPKKPNGQAYDICRGVISRISTVEEQRSVRISAAPLGAGVSLARALLQPARSHEFFRVSSGQRRGG